VNLAQLIERHPADTPALISQGRTTTYGELRDLVADARRRLAEAGVGRDDRVALLGGNTAGFAVAYLATLGLGAVAVPLNTASPAPELVAEITAVTAMAVITSPAGAAAWSKVDRSKVPSVRAVLEIDGAVLVEPVADAPPVVDVDADALAVLAFTSGTAGSPRAARLSHGNLLSNIEQTQATPESVRSGDVVYAVLPCHHIFGLNVVLGLGLYAGACILLVHRFDPSTALDSIAQRGVTVVPGAPPMWIDWAALPDVPADAFARVRLALSGAAKLPEDTARRIHERFGVAIAEGYGLTEAGPAVTSSVGLPFVPGSIGSVLPGIEARLVDDNAEDVVAGDPGELWVRGPNVFSGYWEDEEATARALTPNGWLRTGDVAVTDPEGRLFLVDRTKDLIIVSGFNVYPAEVEAVLAEFPGVAEVAVVGVPHPHTGEAVRAYVVASAGAVLDEEALIGYCADQLARYKCPAKVLFVDEIPRNLAGKVLRRELRS
jgi:long-chain acyl-CoA synthetase